MSTVGKQTKIPSRNDKIYAAGFFDGEGTIDIRYRYTKGKNCKYYRYELRLSISQVDPRPLFWLQARWAGSIVNRRTVHCPLGWVVTGPRARVFLQDIRRYLIVKAEQADVALRFANTFSSTRGNFRRGNARKGRRGFYRNSAKTVEARTRCFYEIRAIRRAMGVKPRNRYPVQASEAILAAASADATLGSSSLSQASGQNDRVRE